MIEELVIKLTVLVTSAVVSFIFGYFKGKDSVKITQLKLNIKDAVKTKKRRKKRNSDDISTIKRRMRRYTIG
tara:strand:- start:334 stop:549 length:216 start_codon:yes stop_codon:yes gene_type:complete